SGLCSHYVSLFRVIRIGSKPSARPAGVNCPKCGKPMVIRSGKRGEFVGCTGYPRCKNAFDLDELDNLKAQQSAGK
ncbi:MAG: topoisomerase DNA-binding C4 zinc finger domain-containing protein, partial [Phycisphaerae bacterium]